MVSPGLQLGQALTRSLQPWWRSDRRWRPKQKMWAAASTPLHPWRRTWGGCPIFVGTMAQWLYSGSLTTHIHIYIYIYVDHYRSIINMCYPLSYHVAWYVLCSMFWIKEQSLASFPSWHQERRRTCWWLHHWWRRVTRCWLHSGLGLPLPQPKLKLLFIGT